MVQWLGLQAFIGRKPGSIPGHGAKIPQAKTKKWRERKDPPQERCTELRMGRKRRGIQGRNKPPQDPILGQGLCLRAPQSLSFSPEVGVIILVL